MNIVNLEPNRMPIRPRRLGVKFDFSRRKRLSQKQVRHNQMVAAKARKTRNLLEEKLKEKRISKSKKKVSNQMTEQEEICNKCRFKYECLAWHEDERLSYCQW